MMEFNLDQFKVRCSAIGDILSESKSNMITPIQEDILARYRKKVDAGKALTGTQKDEMDFLITKEKSGKKLVISDSCISYLMTEYAWLTEGMIPVGKEQLDLAAVKKGNMTELDGISLLIQVDKRPYKIHKDRIYNEFISGEIDAYDGESVMQAKCIVDNKSSWDYPTYLKKLHAKVDGDHKYQIKGYMDITGARDGYVVHTLVDCPPELIENARWALTRKLGAATPESPEVLALWPIWERSMVFGNIPVHKRVHKIKIEPFTTQEQRKVYDKVKVCREWLNNFHEEHQKRNL